MVFIVKMRAIRKNHRSTRDHFGPFWNASDVENGRGETVRVSRAMTSVFAGDTKISEISLRLGIRVDSGRRGGRVERSRDGASIL